MRKNRTDIVGKILQIPFVDKAVDLTAFFICGIGSIHMIHHRDKPYAPFDEFTVQVFFYQFHIARKTRLCFCQNHIKLTPGGRLEHLAERRPVSVHPGIILITVDLINFISVFDGVAHQHGSLVLNALGYPFAFFHFLILFAQPAIERRFHVLPRLSPFTVFTRMARFAQRSRTQPGLCVHPCATYTARAPAPRHK